ncbi:glucoamylase family protein [Consotaella salsifontis]|uniref:Glycoamylase-like domain-containing protein n=1 Tax=Consotaella salsifontis TaxID=1365950 RepID=A0A1T4LH10_9HYPH|nr:glucoamylase family protein [Consotaella salsifontis]SJZ53861.1 hypothetical protein SAMN05428963_101213 [Consotaella salsifontis]
MPDFHALSTLPDQDLLEFVQRETFRFFWEGAQPTSGLARDRCRNSVDPDPSDDLVAIGGSGFGVMALVVAVERGWVSRPDALARLDTMLACLERATCYHGVYPHFMNGRTGATIPFFRKDDGADLVETSLLFQGLLIARRYFDGPDPAEQAVRGRITNLWREVEWNWHTRDGRKVLTWHWSPNNGWSLDHEIRGWNECLITYVLAASSPTYAIDPDVYHRGWAGGPAFRNERRYYDIELPLGMNCGGPLFFSHYSFCGLDPHGLTDRYADYFKQNVSHTLINYEHCRHNAAGHSGYGEACWGLTASDDPDGYSAHAPDNDNGSISPTAALSSFPYAPDQAMAALRHFIGDRGERIFGRYGFVDAFCDNRDWTADTFLAIDQGPIICMIENFRTGLLWRLFMSDPDVRIGLRRLGFDSPYLRAGEA